MSGCGICGPIGWTGFSGKYRVAPGLLEVSEKFHMGYKIGNSGLGSRPRPALRLSLIIPHSPTRCQQANRTKIKKVFQIFLFKSLNRHFYPKSAIRTKKEGFPLYFLFNFHSHSEVGLAFFPHFPSLFDGFFLGVCFNVPVCYDVMNAHRKFFLWYWGSV